MPPAVGPRESDTMVRLYQAGAHLEALARAVNRDVRTVDKVLRQAGVARRQDPPLPADWRAGLAPATLADLQAYGAAVTAWYRATWEAVRAQAQPLAPGQFAFASTPAYHALLQAQPRLDTPEEVATRLDVDLTRVLLVYAAAVDAAELPA